MTGRPLPAAVSRRRDQLAADVFAAAERIRAAGLDDRVREVTIVLPIEHWAVEALELACRALAGGELSPAAVELDRLLGQLATDSADADRFRSAVRSVAGRLGPLGGAPGQG